MTAQPDEPEGVRADVRERLTEEFAGRFSPAALDQVVYAAALDLEGQIVPEAMGEMLHRLAHYRLSLLSAVTENRHAAAQ